MDYARLTLDHLRSGYFILVGKRSRGLRLSLNFFSCTGFQSSLEYNPTVRELDLGASLHPLEVGMLANEIDVPFVHPHSGITQLVHLRSFQFFFLTDLHFKGQFRDILEGQRLHDY